MMNELGKNRLPEALQHSVDGAVQNQSRAVVSRWKSTNRKMVQLVNARDESLGENDENPFFEDNHQD